MSRAAATPPTPLPVSPVEPGDPQRLGERVTTLIDEGEHVGQSARVDRIVAWPLFALATRRMAAYLEAKDPAAEMEALRAMYELYVSQARPVWTLEDQRGPIPARAPDMLVRVPIPLVTDLYHLWVGTFPVAD